MNISDKPTNRILVKAHTDNEWDSCDFAILSISKDWRKTLLERLDAITQAANNQSFLSMHFLTVRRISISREMTDSRTSTNYWETTNGHSWN